MGAWPFDLSGRRVTTGASVGVSTVVSGEVTADELLRRADLRLHAAKRARRAPSRDPRR